MQHVDVKIHDQVATILMDRPAVRNSLHPNLIEDLQTAFSDVHQEKRVRAVILAGSGDHFCAGTDMKTLGEIAAMPEGEAIQQWFAAWRHLTELFEQILRFPKPVIAAVDGAAIGAGFGLALAADIIVPSDRSIFGANSVRRGLVGGATAALLSFRAGGAVAARMTLTGVPIDAPEAYRIGLTMAPVVSQQVWVAAKDVALSCCHGPREAVQANKKMLNESIGEHLLTQIAAGAADSATACTTESAKEGIQSFLEGREPTWP
ncbi:Carnitinyl-CoA dehydratase [Rubripirellula lacrimiformis]|uniref:Carnitinyl-CoA dehydratase n=1 Tax=Rubripirellula lacrimiformis TaxID=1930273 RepID=A0A517NJ33_9BACT|nr:enoyl-CoA hydratase/isomerase family protein [Rubripirellula lacrimiformis]QDT07151.1 Carnitinyl-CoA dehydratase [Rubripirellula lacrimiformis]